MSFTINTRDIKFRKPEAATSTPRGGHHRDRYQESKSGHQKHKKSFADYLKEA